MPEGSLSSVRGAKLLIVGFAVLVVLVVGGRLLSGIYVDVLWYQTTPYSPVLFRRLVAAWTLRFGWGAVVAVALVLNLRLVARTLGGIQIKRRFGNLEISERLPRAYVLWGVIGASAVLGTWFGGAVPENISWAALVAMQGVRWGVTDPVLGHDLSYYVFALPLLRTAVAYLLVLNFLVFTVSMAGYAATGAVRWGRGGVIMGHQSRIHLGLLITFFLVVLALRFWLSRSVLLLSGNSPVQGIFGYTDAEARLPALQLMTVVTLAAAASLLWGVWKNRLVPVLGAFAAVLIGPLLILQFYPSLVQSFRVVPNELARETPFIEHNMEFTRAAFGLSNMDRRIFSYRPSDTVDWAAAREQFEGLPIWPAAALLTTFRATESRFPYYEFQTVDVTRYPAGDGGDLVPVAISVREIDPQGIQDPAWQNQHLREIYIMGMGAVATAAAQRTPEGRPPMYLGAIPPEFTGGPNAPQGLRLARPAVFFGSREQRYAIVNGSTMRSPEGMDATVGVDFPEGILLDRPLRKLALAWRFRDANLLFTSEITDSSRMVFRRRVRERAEEIAPFFRYLEEPYAVVADGRIVWILEAFTVTRGFPLARALELELRAPASYVRNSVKVTVDAVTGETLFYALPDVDPLRDAYALAFPGLLRPIDEMPEALRAHLRYSKTLAAIQAAVLLQYHQETAPRFHGQQDAWQTPTEFFQSTTPVPYRPEYSLYRLPGETRPTFNLTTAFVPAGRQNLTGVLVGRLDDQGAPELILYDVPVEDQAPGPRQVEALVEQDPEISQQFSLWRTGGSQVWLGHLHMVPVGSQIFYMEPVFLAAADQAIPELRRFVVSDGRRVSMEATLDEALAALGGDLSQLGLDRVGQGAALPAPGADPSGWPREALDLMELAEQRLRAGDYSGFGSALERLRQILERAAGGGG